MSSEIRALKSTPLQSGLYALGTHERYRISNQEIRIMWKKLLWLVLGLTLTGLLAITVVGYLIYQQAPSAPAAGQTLVLAMPPGQTSSYPAYAGEHPRLQQRPAETWDFPIRLGETGPAEALFAGEKQYPFLCGRDNSRDWLENANVQPEPDNQLGYGIPIHAVHENRADPNTVIGYSMDCLFPSQARYYYNKKGSTDFFPLEEADGDIEQITVNGEQIDFIVRLETGTINRFFYAIAVLRGENETIDSPESDYWNKRLIYQFSGGVGIGRQQGNFSTRNIFRDRYEQLRQGYAVVFSSANDTSNHYNIWLAEDTALRVKTQFTALYEEPLYTVGIGGSGGALQQYLLAQNHPGIIDAAIPLYSYPDMVTQTIHILDCELLEYYFDATAADEPLWQTWENRRWIEGLNASSAVSSPFAALVAIQALSGGNPADALKAWRGSSECANAWRGLTPLINNPKFALESVDYAPAVADSVQWTHWDDLREFYGRDAAGFANSPWDNIGVQYGLQALQQGLITPQTFLDLNAKVGGWVTQDAMQAEKFWFLTGGALFPPEINLWGEHNMTVKPFSQGLTVAPRSQGSLAAIQGIYRSGHVFLGIADIPIIDLRHYLDPVLDMHHSSASFSTRARMIKAQGHADNQLIWMTTIPHDPQAEAFALIDEWMSNMRQYPLRSVVANKPAQASDSCFSAKGELIAAGADVWDGPWNGKPAGACMQVYPAYQTSREVAGNAVSADVFKCHRQSVTQAIATGVYGSIDMHPYLQQLQAIFPEGVCDYSQGDAGLPAGLMQQIQQQQ
ncbi:MAG: DUF6351 family protein [Pseudomonadales bacterium]|nr:DUF6351 family protein [Pseudomonadales bacterium]